MTRELIDRALLYRKDNLRETTVGFALFGELASELQSLSERIDELEEKLAGAYKRGWREGCETSLDDYEISGLLETPHPDAMGEGCGNFMSEYYASLTKESDQALAVPVEPVSRLDPTGFDPSRLEDAIAFAAHCHKGQLDKAGEPYILHPLRVMLRLNDEDKRIAAVLHDVVEDCGVEPVFIRMGYGDAVADAVEALTRRKGETYADFIERCGANDIARAVKWADLRDNMDLTRLGTVTEADMKRQDKYRAAKDRLTAIAGRDREYGLGGEAMTARAEGIAH